MVDDPGRRQSITSCINLSLYTRILAEDLNGDGDKDNAEEFADYSNAGRTKQLFDKIE